MARPRTLGVGFDVGWCWSDSQARPASPSSSTMAVGVGRDSEPVEPVQEKIVKIAMLIRLILGFFLAYLLALVGVPMARQAALDFGVIDRPDGKLKNHKEPVPYLGGLAVFTAFLLSLGMTFELDYELLALLLASKIVATLGLIDDFGVLTPKAKVLRPLLHPGTGANVYSDRYCVRCA